MRVPDSTLASALRDAGFVPLKRLWIHENAVPEILKITERFREDVNAIRRSLGDTSSLEARADYSDPFEDAPLDPRSSKDAAWEAFERDRGR